jgi:hypothetical protein
MKKFIFHRQRHPLVSINHSHVILTIGWWLDGTLSTVLSYSDKLMTNFQLKLDQGAPIGTIMAFLDSSRGVAKNYLKGRRGGGG